MLDTNTTLRDLITQEILETLNSKIETVLPAVVTDVSRYKQFQQVSLKVVVNQVFPDGQALTGADLLHVPVVLPSGGGGALTFPISIGDLMTVVFSKRCIDEWKNGDGSALTPRLVRRFDKGDGIAIPGLSTTLNNVNPDPDNVVLKYAGSEVVLFKNGDVKVSAANDLNAMAAGNISLNSLGNISIMAGGTVSIQGSQIHLNEN